jgi:site-specific recombinase XerD
MTHGRRIGPESVRKALLRIAEQAGLGPVTPHQLRHTLATQAINRGMSLEAIAALLGHKSMRMTMVYAKCAARRSVVSPAQPGGTRRKVLGSNDLPRSER